MPEKEYIATIKAGEKVFQTELLSELHGRLSLDHTVSIMVNGSYVSGGSIVPFKRTELPRCVARFTAGMSDIVFLQILEEPREGQSMLYRLKSYTWADVTYVYQQINGQNPVPGRIRRLCPCLSEGGV